MITMSDFKLDDSYGYLINLAAQRLKYELHQVFQAKGYDITPEQWAVLNRLWEEDGLSQVEIAERTFKDKPSTTRILNLLEKKGVVLRRRDTEDGRVMHVFLTKAGKDLKEKLIPCAEEVLVKSGQNLTKEEVSQFKQILRKILANLE
jgi:MarR family transcriptional regulator, organic hydroperoxide resistance regulator